MTVPSFRKIKPFLQDNARRHERDLGIRSAIDYDSGYNEIHLSNLKLHLENMSNSHLIKMSSPPISDSGYQGDDEEYRGLGVMAMIDYESVDNDSANDDNNDDKTMTSPADGR